MNVDSLLSSKDATIVSARFQSLNLRSSAIAQRALESRYDVPDKSGSEDLEEYEEFATHVLMSNRQDDCCSKRD
jgi:hypothetical protein